MENAFEADTSKHNKYTSKRRIILPSSSAVEVLRSRENQTKRRRRIFRAAYLASIWQIEHILLFLRIAPTCSLAHALLGLAVAPSGFPSPDATACPPILLRLHAIYRNTATQSSTPGVGWGHKARPVSQNDVNNRSRRKAIRRSGWSLIVAVGSGTSVGRRQPAQTAPHHNGDRGARTVRPTS